MTTAEAAASLNVNASRIRQMILAKELPATKMGRDWLIRESDLEACRKARETDAPREGRPYKRAKPEAG